MNFVPERKILLENLGCKTRIKSTDLLIFYTLYKTHTHTHTREILFDLYNCTSLDLGRLLSS